MRVLTRGSAALVMLTGSAALGLAFTLSTQVPAFADGPAPCSVGGPPFPYAGFCATYSGANTWYGSYGPGFPTDEGWGFCADPPASGGDYPAPGYAYVSSSPPRGADIAGTAALGFAFSEAQALGLWGGTTGRFTTDQAAVAGKLLYDAVVWSSPVPAMDPGVLAAYQTLDGWYTAAVGATGGPQLTGTISGGSTSFTGQTTYEVTARFPGTGKPAVGLPVELSVAGASLDSDAGPSTVTEATDASGRALFTIVAASPGQVTVDASVPGGIGQPGLSFLSPSSGEFGAQQLVAFSSPAASSAHEQITALPTTGTLSIVKGGDDTAYYPVSGAVFVVERQAARVATLTTGSDGTTPASPQLPTGTYTVHEQVAPPGYGASADQTVSITAGTNTVVSFTGANEDHVLPASMTIEKTELTTGAPLEGAAFDVAYDSGNDGTYRDIGTCTTSSGGSCAPAGNDGADHFLPGRYRITETAPPQGFALPSPAFEIVDLLAGESADVSFGDAKLVSAVFKKVASGNVNPAELVLDGAQIEVDEGTPGGPSVASCSTNAAGICTTPTVLKSGTKYCWIERAAPPGLAGGANGCFTADDSQANQPITVSDAGEFVAIEVKKVDAANPAVGLAGATFNLYRVTTPAVPSAIAEAPRGGSGNGILVATTTTGAHGVGTFPLQLPGYSYCAIESQAPPNYQTDATPQCTPVLTGATAVPPTTTTLTFDDAEETVDLEVFKYNSLTPSTVIPGATYDLYVQGPPPPGGVGSAPPAGVAVETGDTWYARGTTDKDGRLSFVVPAGYAWCVREVSAPLNYVLDPALHCSAVITTTSSATASTISIGETLATVHVSAYKYDALEANTVIPGAAYELLANGSHPPGSRAQVPKNAVVPSGDAFFAEGTTNAQGVLTFAVPAGYSWCLHELTAPPDYRTDAAYHCTAVLTTDTSSTAATLAVPETPLTGSLPFTGFPALWVGFVGGTLLMTGAGLLVIGRRRVRS